MNDIYDFFGGEDVNADLYQDYSDDWFSSGDYSNYANDAASLGDYSNAGLDSYDFFGDVDPNAADYKNYSDDWFSSPDLSGYSEIGSVEPRYADAGFGSAADQGSSGGSWLQPIYDAEKWTNQHKGLTSAGVAGLSFLTSMQSAKKKEKQQKKAYDAYMAEKAAAAARKAASDAPWTPTPYRTRNEIAGPSVNDRYGVSTRGAAGFVPPSSYNYYDNNRVQLAKGGLARACDCRRPSGGQDDNVRALLSEGEYVFDADAVAALGDGNNAAGAAKLDEMRANIRTHKRAAPSNKIPPKAKAPEAYLAKKGK